MIKKVLTWIGAIAVGLFVIGVVFGSGDEAEIDVSSEPEQQEEETVTAEPTEESEEPTITDTDDTETVEETTEPDPVEDEPSMSMEQQNAIGSAESYIASMGFSKSGLVEQLEFEGYSTESAEFAVNNINVDWKQEAVESAESYIDTMSFSRSGLVDQLKFEGYTDGQANYAADQVGY